MATLGDSAWPKDMKSGHNKNKPSHYTLISYLCFIKL